MAMGDTEVEVDIGELGNQDGVDIKQVNIKIKVGTRIKVNIKDAQNLYFMDIEADYFSWGLSLAVNPINFPFKYL